MLTQTFELERVAVDLGAACYRLLLFTLTLLRRHGIVRHREQA